MLVYWFCVFVRLVWRFWENQSRIHSVMSLLDRLGELLGRYVYMQVYGVGWPNTITIRVYHKSVGFYDELTKTKMKLEVFRNLIRSQYKVYQIESVFTVLRFSTTIIEFLKGQRERIKLLLHIGVLILPKFSNCSCGESKDVYKRRERCSKKPCLKVPCKSYPMSKYQKLVKRTRKISNLASVLTDD